MNSSKTAKHRVEVPNPEESFRRASELAQRVLAVPKVSKQAVQKKKPVHR
jgi:hypothetical protein